MLWYYVMLLYYTVTLCCDVMLLCYVPILCYHMLLPYAGIPHFYPNLNNVTLSYIACAKSEPLKKIFSILWPCHVLKGDSVRVD